MIKNINDLSMFLSVINNFPKDKGTPKNELFSSIRNKYSYVQWDVQTNELLDIGLRLNLFKMHNKFIFLTPYGKNLYDMNTGSIDLNTRQFAYIVENCIFNNSNFDHLLKFLSLFVYDPNSKSTIYDSADYHIPQMDVEILTQLKIIFKNGSIWKLNSIYSDLVDIIKYKINREEGSIKSGITQEQFDAMLSEQKEIGARGESLTMIYEKERLKKQKLFKESQNIKQISVTNVSAGYDIASFKNMSLSLKHNLFIEVKSRKHYLNSFMMSSNELSVAKKLGKNYAIYFWNGLSHGDPIEPAHIIIDPVNILKITECKNCLSYLITLDKHN